MSNRNCGADKDIPPMDSGSDNSSDICGIAGRSHPWQVVGRDKPGNICCDRYGGVPWFAGYNACAIGGPTGGYIIGFILAALFIGHLTDSCMGNMGLLPIFALMFFSNFFLIYGPGLLQLGLWHYLIEGERIAIRELLLIGVVPFIAGDLIKIAAAASLARAINDKIG